VRRFALAGALLAASVIGALLFWDGLARRGWDKRANGRPNIVLVIIDTLRADRLNIYRKSLPEGVAPELDSYANRGVRFDRAISQSSWTRPSIGSFLTSQYPRTLGLFVEKGDALSEHYVTVAEVLKAAGYRTLGLTANPNINSAYGFDQGFHTYVNSGVVWKPHQGGDLLAEEHPLRSALEIFAQALELVREAPKAPTFLMINVMEVHEYLNMYRSMLRQGAGPYFRGFGSGREIRYLRLVHQVSQDIGQFVEELTAVPGWENPLFVFVSDHGEGLDSHPSVAEAHHHGKLLYDSQNWVPWILFRPQGGLPKGRVVERPVRLLDLMPTILDIARVEGPTDMEGVSLLPLIDDPDAPIDLPDFFVVETQFRGVDKVGVYAQDAKLIHNLKPHEGTNALELQPNRVYEDGIRTDVGEQQPERRNELAEYLSRWEQEHPKANASTPGAELSPTEIEQLRAIGYVE